VIGATTLLAVNYFVVRFLYGHKRLDHIIEGDCDELMTDGKIRHDRLKKELLTETSLETAAHRQGFASLKDIERAVLEVGGSISFFPKDPTPEMARHNEILAGLKRVTAELDELRKVESRRREPAKHIANGNSPSNFLARHGRRDARRRADHVD